MSREWAEGTYEIATAEGGRREVPGFTYAGLGLRAEQDVMAWVPKEWFWVITHLRTGMKLGFIYAEDQAEALDIAGQIAELGDWDAIISTEDAGASTQLAEGLSRLRDELWGQLFIAGPEHDEDELDCVPVAFFKMERLMERLNAEAAASTR